MKVRVFDVIDNKDGTTRHEFVCECDLSECYPDDTLSMMIAREALLETGEHLEGGGSMPLSLLVLDQ